METIQFQCPRCGKGLSAPADKAGQSAKCPSCGAAFQIQQAPASKPKPVTGPPMPPARPASTAPQFYYAQNGQRFGPLTLKQMQERIALHQLRPQDLVWREGMSQWVAAQEVPELFSPPAATPTVQPKQPPHASQPVRPVPSGSAQPITSGMRSLGAMKLQLLGNAAKALFLQLYCPMRKRREGGAEGSWLLLALLPTAGLLLLGLVLCMIATGVGIAVALIGALYATFVLYVSFFGPTAQKAAAVLAAVGPRRQELRGLIQQQEKVQQQQKLLRPSRRAPPLPHRTPAEQVPPPSVIWSDTKCSRCKYLAPRKKCACCDSPSFTRSVEPTHVCPRFELNPAQDYYSQATAHIIKEDASAETTTQLLETAVQGGLPEDEDVLARTFLASQYADLAFSRHPDDFNAGVCDPLLSEALKQVEHAVRVDVEQRYGVFASAHNTAMLSRFDASYTALICEVLDKTLSRDALLAYLKERDAFFGRVPGDPMIYLLEALGIAYYNRGERQTAKVYFQRMLNSESGHDQETVAQMKDVARKHLQDLG